MVYRQGDYGIIIFDAVLSPLISKRLLMAPPRKKRIAPSQTHPVHLRLPGDVFARLEAKAKQNIWPLNRVIINELAAYPTLEQNARFGELVDHMETTLARYGSRIVATELADALLRAIRDVLDANTDGERRSRIDRLRVLHADWLKQEGIAK
jgi:hypothetical protein